MISARAAVRKRALTRPPPAPMVSRVHGSDEASRAQLHALFMQAPVAIAIQEGPELRWALANPPYRELLAHQPLVGKAMREVVPGDATLLGILERVYATGEPYGGREFPLRVLRGGELREAYFHFTCQPTRAPDGSVDGVITFAVEVTQEVEARKRVEALAH